MLCKSGVCCFYPNITLNDHEIFIALPYSLMRINVASLKNILLDLSLTILVPHTYILCQNVIGIYLFSDKIWRSNSHIVHSWEISFIRTQLLFTQSYLASERTSSRRRDGRRAQLRTIIPAPQFWNTFSPRRVCGSRLRACGAGPDTTTASSLQNCTLLYLSLAYLSSALITTQT